MRTSLPLLLAASGALALAVGVFVQRRRGAPGVRVFGWLMAAIAGWCATSAAHALVATLGAKIFLAQIQYIAIVSVAPLWLLFTAEYAGVTWAADRRVRRALWVLPALTAMLAASNEWHRAIWPSVHIDESGAAVYAHGWWFWLDAAYNYALLATGAALIVRLWDRTPAFFRGQFAILLAASAVPWAGNLAYLAGLTPAGVDLTPIAFAASGVLFAVALRRDQIFDLVPIARDRVIDSMSDAVIVVDEARRIVDLNATARQLARGRAAEGRALADVLPMLAATAFDEAAESSSSVDEETEATTRHFDVRVMPVRSHGRAAWILVVRDVTIERRAAAEREALQARVQEQQRRESLSILAAGLAHDFNNLLQSIVGNGDLLSRKLPPHSDLGRYVSAIMLGSQRAAGLVSKMLAYAGERQGSISRVDLYVVISELLDLLRASAGRHCTIEQRGTHAVIVADATQVRQVAMNLIINAAEAVDEGGTVIVTTGSDVLTRDRLDAMDRAEDAAAGAFAILEVQDNGPGIDGDTRRRIFQPFFTTKAGGHGLGLAAVEGIVRGHRGALRVESAPGHGSRFQVWLPLAEGAEVTEGEFTGGTEMNGGETERDRSRRPAPDHERAGTTGRTSV